jgi:hypothetical protein
MAAPSFDDYYLKRFGSQIFNQGMQDLVNSGSIQQGWTSANGNPAPTRGSSSLFGDQGNGSMTNPMARPNTPPPGPTPGGAPTGNTPGTPPPQYTPTNVTRPQSLGNPTAAPGEGGTPKAGKGGIPLVAGQTLPGGGGPTGGSLPGGGGGTPTSQGGGNNQSVLDQVRNGRSPFGNRSNSIYMGGPNIAPTDADRREQPVLDGMQRNNLNEGMAPYYDQYYLGGGDGNTEYGYRLKPQWVQHFRDTHGWDVTNPAVGGPVQIGVEGFDANRIKDASQVRYDPEFGLVTFEGNIIPEDDDYGRDFFRGTSAVLGGVVGAHAFGLGMGEPAGFSIDPSSGGIAGPAGQFNGVPWAGTGPTPTPSGPAPTPNTPIGGEPLTPLEPVPGPNYTPITPGTGVPGAGIGMPSAGTLLRGGSLVASLVGGGGGGGGGRGGPSIGGGPGGGGDGGRGTNIFDLVSNGLGAYQSNRNIQSWKNNTTDLINRGDWNQRDRQAYMDRLRNFMMNPQAALEDPAYQQMRERAEMDLSRKMAARGLNLSGNELGDLTQLRTEMDYKQIQSERDQLMKAAGLGDPRGMVESALRNLPALYNMKNSNDTATAANLRGWLTQNLPGLVSKGADYVDKFINYLRGSGSMPEGANEFIDQLAQQSGLPRDVFLEQWRSGGGSHVWGGDTDGPPTGWENWNEDDWNSWIWGE